MSKEVQATILKVIELGFYPHSDDHSKTSDYMCFALHHALIAGHIRVSEYMAARTEICEYIRPFTSLSELLGYKNQTSGIFIPITVNLKFYQNWENRPDWRANLCQIQTV